MFILPLSCCLLFLTTFLFLTFPAKALICDHKKSSAAQMFCICGQNILKRYRCRLLLIHYLNLLDLLFSVFDNSISDIVCEGYIHFSWFFLTQTARIVVGASAEHLSDDLMVVKDRWLSSVHY